MLDLTFFILLKAGLYIISIITMPVLGSHPCFTGFPMKRKKLRPSGTEFSFLICVLFLSTCDCNLEILGICKDLVLVRILLLFDCALDDYA